MPMSDAADAPRIAIVGATGAVGTTLARLIEERDFRYRAVHLVASARSAGKELPLDGTTHRVQDLAGFDFSTVDIAFFSAGTEVSRQWVPSAVAAGALVIDNTNAFRMDPDTPLVVPQVNAGRLDERPVSGIIANPNCSTIPLVRLLHPVQREWGVEQVVVSTYQAASGRGHSGISELREDTRRALARPEEAPIAKEFTPSLAFDLVPSIDQPLDDGFTLEEQKMRQESAKILGLPGFDLTATCVRVPVVNSHSEAVWVRTASEVDRDRLMEVLAQAPEVTVYDTLATGAFPTPRTTQDPDQVHVGRIRITPQDRRAFWMWIVADNLRIGAALNALQIAEELVRRGTR
ncbi:aspartate-semialdehyde dehydrogenase [Streptomyces sp. NPDC002812]|uniref:aspartate-semialdehyde dehydrogenase n=1 Tax=Streptomyces sp. NPDC002812 TaxID=3154434 RepID=UPI00331885D0